MAEKKEKSGKGIKIVIITLLVLIVFGLGFVGFLLIRNGSLAQNTDKTVQVVNPGGQKEEVSKTSPYTYNLDEFLVNLSDEGGKKLFKAKIYIGYDTENKKKMDVQLEERVPILRDIINTVLRSKKSTDITTKDKVDELKKEIIEKINPYFTYGRASNVYFYDIIVQ